MEKAPDRAEFDKHLADAAVADVARQVAHDIRSPLAALDMVAKDVSALPEDHRILIRSAVSRIHDIANNLLEVHRQASAASEPDSVCLLSSLVEPLITEKRLQHRNRAEVEIDSRLDESSYGLFAKVQPVEFKRAVSNLVNNAVEAFKGNAGTILVGIAEEGGRVLARVRDDGEGIPPEILAKLGQKWESHGKANGNGLGLYHARSCAEAWGGSLELASEVGKGTTVTMILPQAPAPDWFVSRLALEPGQTIVILDDDPSIHQVWRGRLNSPGLAAAIEAVHFSTPHDLRRWVGENAARARAALYLFDYELLGYKETGLKLAEELGLGGRMILVTSRYEDPGMPDRCRKLNARMIPKGLAGLVPIAIAKRYAARAEGAASTHSRSAMNWRPVW